MYSVNPVNYGVDATAIEIDWFRAVIRPICTRPGQVMYTEFELPSPKINWESKVSAYVPHGL